ncbi:MAG: DUF1080 domain-containing protein [Acidobacteria bacterium]|nr:DUF1080 domain-containing protein [Acidobacteriota bacterium]
MTAAWLAFAILIHEQFPGAALDSSWKVNKGKWEVSGGVVKGTELASDKHAAVIRRAVNYRNAVIEFDFKLAGADWVALSINKKGAHVSRVVVGPTGFRVQKDTPGVVLGKSDAAVPANEWHTMRVVVDGKKMTATLDGKITVGGEHEAIDVDKADIGFPVKGDSVYLRNIRLSAK